MNHQKDAMRTTINTERHPILKRLGRIVFLVAALRVTPLLHAQGPLVLVSVTPADGATDVPTSSTLVFVLDQALSLGVVPVPSFPPFLIGSFEITPSTISFAATVSNGRKTITLTSAIPLPENTLITWKLNPPGGGATFTLANTAGQALATTSGSFRTKSNASGAVPKVISTSPARGATGVSFTSPVEIIFDQDMDTSVPLEATVLVNFPGNYDFKPQGNFLEGSWGEDKRTLTFIPAGFLARDTVITWTLNPAGTTKPIKSAGGQLLATTSGTFKTVKSSLGPASTNELCNVSVPISTNGLYTLTKQFQYLQSAADVLMPHDVSVPFSFSAFVQGPTFGPAVTNASFTPPSGVRQLITNQFGLPNYISAHPTEAALEAAFPPGAYLYRFQQIGLPERSVTMNLPATPPSIPRIVNIAAAQAVDAAAPFTLSWNAFSPTGPGANIQLTIIDEIGNIVFTAPNFCVPRVLAPGDTSVTIPANYFLPGLKYEGILRFGTTFHSDTNSVPGMSGYGNLSRSTSFPLKTSGGGGGGPLPEPAAARFTAFQLLSNGRPQLTLTGTPTRSYTIQRKGNLAATIWATAGTATMSAGGSAVFEDPTVNLQFPAFYRAVGN